MPAWEQKWDDFKNEDVRKEIEQDEQIATACKEVRDYIKAHSQEIESQIKVDESSDVYPRDTVKTSEFEGQIAGHDVYWKDVQTMDRDGGNEDGASELSVDGVTVWDDNSSASFAIPKAAQEIIELLGEMVWYN